MANELDTLLRIWGARRDVATVAADADPFGRRYLTFDGEHEIACFQTGTDLVLEAEIGALPARRDEAEAVLERHLNTQLARAYRSSEVLSLAPDSGRLVLFRTLDARATELAAFDSALSSFVNAQAFWSAEHRSSAVAPRAASPVAQFLYP